MASISASGIGCAILTAILLSSASAGVSQSQSNAPARLTITVEGARSARGLLRLCISASPSHFPDCSGDASSRQLSVPAGQQALDVEGLRAGTYAISILHDENGNGRMDKLFAIPREGFGFSRNPRIGVGPPRFSAAAVVLTGQQDQQTIRLRYVF